MNEPRRCLRAGALVIAAAIALRLLSGGFLSPLWQTLTQPETVAMLMYLETGRVIRPSSRFTYPAESAIPEVGTVPVTVSPTAPIFSAHAVSEISLDNETNYSPDLQSLLTAPLEWDLTDGMPRVLIVHTHGTESYTPTADEIYEETADYRTLDSEFNMICIGDALTQKLQQAGIVTLHDREYHDYPSYNGSYTSARTAIETTLEETPTLCLVLDLHRDAAATADGGQLRTCVQLKDGREVARLMIVTGTDAGGLEHPHWQTNLSLALKLQLQLEQLVPGLCRPINLCAERFNTDLTPGSLLIEIGAAGNSRQEALRAADALADGIIALAHGANLTADSTN